MLEARDRVGGRTLNHRVQKGVIAEIGGQYVGPTQDRVLALAKSVGVDIFPTYNDGDNVLLLNGAAVALPGHAGAVAGPRLPGGDPQVDQRAQPDGRGGARRRALEGAQGRAEWDKTRSRPVERPEPSPRPASRALFDIAAEALWGAEPRELTLLYALAYTATAGNEKNKGDFARSDRDPGRRPGEPLRGRLAAHPACWWRRSSARRSC